MPVSTPVHISHCLERILSVKPESVLDVGCGFGLWGFLCREYLDVWDGRVTPPEWQTRIDGIEVFEPYIQAHQSALYTNILVEDVREVVEEIGQYDLIIAGDVIEHLEKPDAEIVLEVLYEKARKALLLNIPIGDGWDHPEAHGNPAELHRSRWEIEDFTQYPSESTMFDLPCGKYGVFWCIKDVPANLRAEGLVVAAETREQRGENQAALRFLRQAQRVDPENEAVLVSLVSFLLKFGQTGQAVDCLRDAVQKQPGRHSVRLLLARVLALASRHDEAHHELESLLNAPDVPAQIAGEARKYAEDIRRRFD